MMPPPGRPKHNGLVAPDGVNWETERATWRASCSCGWAHPHANSRWENANRALFRHLRDAGVGLRPVGGTVVGTPPPQAQPPN